MDDQMNNILLVEDDAGHAELVRRAFDSYGSLLALTIVGSLQEAKDYLAETIPALVITDLLLPDGKGTELLQPGNGTPNFPMVIITSHGDEQIAVDAIKRGALDYVVKSETALIDIPHVAERALREWENIIKRKCAEDAIRKANDELERRVEERTGELLKANDKLQHEICERKRLEKALAQKEKLKTLGAIAAEVAHEIRNPLVCIGGFARRLKKKFPDLSECDIILSESRRLEKILSRIRNYLKPVEIHRQKCSINTVLTDCLNLLCPEMERRQVMCTLDLAPKLPVVYIDPEILTQIFINLIRNAAEAMDKKGTLDIKTFESDQDLHIEFKNKASGSKVKNPEALFMPFGEGGQSIGLPLCYRLLKDMDGHLLFTQKKDYMVFTVSLSKASLKRAEKNERSKE